MQISPRSRYWEVSQAPSLTPPNLYFILCNSISLFWTYSVDQLLFLLIFFHTLYVQGPEEVKLIQAQFNRYSCGNQSHHRNYIGYFKVYAIDPGTFEELGVLNQSIATDNRLLLCVLQEIWGVMGFIWETPEEQPWEVSWSKANLNRVLTCE